MMHEDLEQYQEYIHYAQQGPLTHVRHAPRPTQQRSSAVPTQRRECATCMYVHHQDNDWCDLSASSEDSEPPAAKVFCWQVLRWGVS